MTKTETISLSEMSRRSGVSLPALLRYKKAHGGPGGVLNKFFVGTGRAAKIKVTAEAQLLKLRDQGLARRGKRPGTVR